MFIPLYNRSNPSYCYTYVKCKYGCNLYLLLQNQILPPFLQLPRESIRMKPFLPVLFISLFLLSSCTPQVKRVSDKEVAAKADSIVRQRQADIKKAAADDLEKRMAIEVKAKADSIVDVRLHGVPKVIMSQEDSLQANRRQMFEQMKRKRRDTTTR